MPIFMGISPTSMTMFTNLSKIITFPGCYKKHIILKQGAKETDLPFVAQLIAMAHVPLFCTFWLQPEGHLPIPVCRERGHGCKAPGHFL